VVLKNFSEVIALLDKKLLLRKYLQLYSLIPVLLSLPIFTLFLHGIMNKLLLPLMIRSMDNKVKKQITISKYVLESKMLIMMQYMNSLGKFHILDQIWLLNLRILLIKLYLMKVGVLETLESISKIYHHINLLSRVFHVLRSSLNVTMKDNAFLYVPEMKTLHFPNGLKKSEVYGYQ